MKIACISDTHNRHRKITGSIPEADVLIHAGDISMTGEFSVFADFNEWLAELPHKHKIVVPGNHDFLFEENPGAARGMLTNATVLIDEALDIDGFRFYGSPFTPSFGSWAFMRRRGHGKRNDGMFEKWLEIPHTTDVLITHGPPEGVLDLSCYPDPKNRTHAGCRDLAAVVMGIRPALHVFGHIHAGYGRYDSATNDITFVNAAIVDEEYQPANMPWLIDLCPICKRVCDIEREGLTYCDDVWYHSRCVPEWFYDTGKVSRWEDETP